MVAKMRYDLFDDCDGRFRKSVYEDVEFNSVEELQERAGEFVRDANRRVMQCEWYVMGIE